ncbi:ankyrin repeat-containing domain protein [Cladorrhinum sp. PSN259]|nr:ankyrin repeat-containing domain protein [Cladorrhinum sp. PSN259]
MAPTHSRPSDDEWEAHKAAIRRFYLVDGKSQKQLLEAVQGLGLSVTKAQLEYRLKLWKFKRNIDKETWPYIDNRINKRARLGKPSEVIYGGRRVKPSTIEKETKRHQDNTYLAQIAPAPSPRTPNDVQISICTPQPFPMEFFWPRSLPWLQFRLNYPDFLSFLHPQRNRPARPIDSQLLAGDVSGSLISSFFQGRAMNQPPSPSMLASTMGITIPEVYAGENLARAEVILRGSGPELLRESMMVEIFRISNNFVTPQWWDNDHHNEWEHVVAALRQSGITSSPVNFRSLNNTTVSAFMENLFRWAFLQVLNTKDSDRPSEDSLQAEHGADEYYRQKHEPYQKLLKIVEWSLQSGQNTGILLGILDSAHDTPLQHAVLHDRRDLVQLLLSNGAEVNDAADGTAAPLCIAASNFKANQSDRVPDMVYLLLDSGARITSESFQRAVASGNLSLIQLLVDRGEPRNLALPGVLAVAARINDQSRALNMVSYIIGLLESQGHNLDSITRATKAEVLVGAAASANNDVLRHLHGLRFDINTPNTDGVTPIHAAALEGHYATCMLLVHLGAQINNNWGNPSPLHLASFKGHVNIVDLLVTEGAEVNLILGRMQRGQIEAYFGFMADDCCHWLQRGSLSALSIALRRIKLRCATKLIEKGARLEGKELPIAATHADTELFYAAIRAGADLNHIDDSGRSILQLSLLTESSCGYSEELKRLQIAAFLLDSQAWLRGGELISALRLGNASLVERLVAHGAWLTSDPLDLEIGALEAAVLSEKPEMAHMVLDWYPGTYEAGAVTAAIKTKKGYEFINSILINRPNARPLSSREIEAVAVITEHRNEPAQQNGPVFELLLTSLPDPTQSAQKRHHQTPLIAALDNKDEYALRRLLSHGYRPHWETLAALAMTNDASLARIIINNDSINDPSYFVLASLQRHDCVLTRCRFGHCRWTGSCPLARAAQHKNMEMLQLLLQTGLDVNNRVGLEAPGLRYSVRSALQQATEDANLPLMDVLLKAGADVNAPAALLGGATALQLAAINGHLGIAKQLLDLGADPNACQARKEGRTALEGAAEMGRIDMIDLLLKSGVQTNGIGRVQYLRAIRFAELQGHNVAAEHLKSFRDWMEVDEAIMGVLDELDLAIMEEDMEDEFAEILAYYPDSDGEDDSNNDQEDSGEDMEMAD